MDAVENYVCLKLNYRFLSMDSNGMNNFFPEKIQRYCLYCLYRLRMWQYVCILYTDSLKRRYEKHGYEDLRFIILHIYLFYALNKTNIYFKIPLNNFLNFYFQFEKSLCVVWWRLWKWLKSRCKIMILKYNSLVFIGLIYWSSNSLFINHEQEIIF